jgi:Domain of unknown function (DUF6249)
MNSEIFIPAIIFGFFAYVIKILSDNRVRNRLIEKGLVDEKVKFLYHSDIRLKNFTSIKWGMLLIALGLALLIGQLLPYDDHEELTMGLMFLFGGVAFLAYYFMAKRMLDKNPVAE